MVVFASLNEYKFLMSSKAMPQQSNHDFKEQYVTKRIVGPLEPMCIKEFNHISTTMIVFASLQDFK